MSVEALCISSLVEDGVSTLRTFYSNGVTNDDFPIYAEEFDWIEKRIARRKTLNWRIFRQRFPDFDKTLPKESAKDLALELREERAYEEVNALVATLAETLERDNALELAVGAKDEIARITRTHSPMSDAVLEEWVDDVQEMRRLMRLAKAGTPIGLKTGFDHLDHHWGGLIPGQTIQILGRTGEGKALSLSTLLPTPSGWTTMGDIQMGDKLFDELGLPCEVEWVGPIVTEGSWRVSFSDGSHIVANDEHLWLTHTDASRKSEVNRRAKALARGGRPLNEDRVASHPQCQVTEMPGVVSTAEIRQTLKRNGRANHAVRNTLPLQLPEAILPIDPYVFGVWLGDGTAGTNQVTSMDKEIWQAIEAAGYELGVVAQKGRAVRRTLKGMRKQLTALDVLGNKHIPDIYLRASEAQRLALLQGLMDTDGFWSNRSAEIGQVDKRLATQIYELVVSLGMKATWRVKHPTLNGKLCSRAYLVKFSPTMPVFRLKRKLAQWTRTDAQSERKTRRYITEVAKISDVPMRCIRVSSSSHLFLAGEAMIPTHNSLKVTAIGLAAKLQGANVGIFTPELSKHEVKCRLHTLASARPEIQKACDLKRSFRNRALLFRQGFNLKSYQSFCEYFATLPGKTYLLSGQHRREKMSVGYIEDKIVEYGLDLVIVDPIYLLKPVRMYKENKTAEIGDTAEALEVLAETYSIPLIFTNQANRQGGAQGDAPHKDRSYNSDVPNHVSDYILGVKHMSDENRMICRCTKSRFGQEFRYEVDLYANTGVIRERTPLSGNYYNGNHEVEEDELKEMVATAIEGSDNE